MLPYVDRRCRAACVRHFSKFMTDAYKYAKTCAEAAADKKASDIVALDMTGISDFTDVFMIISADSEPQIKAVASGIREKMREQHGLHVLAEDGFPSSQWIVLDYGDIIIHIFHPTKRALYNLERLWSDAKRIEF